MNAASTATIRGAGCDPSDSYDVRFGEGSLGLALHASAPLARVKEVLLVFDAEQTDGAFPLMVAEY